MARGGRTQYPAGGFDLMIDHCMYIKPKIKEKGVSTVQTVEHSKIITNQMNTLKKAYFFDFLFI